jgi:hypothetical protein
MNRIDRVRLSCCIAIECESEVIDSTENLDLLLSNKDRLTWNMFVGKCV